MSTLSNNGYETNGHRIVRPRSNLPNRLPDKLSHLHNANGLYLAFSTSPVPKLISKSRDIHITSAHTKIGYAGKGFAARAQQYRHLLGERLEFWPVIQLPDHQLRPMEDEVKAAMYERYPGVMSNRHGEWFEIEDREAVRDLILEICTSRKVSGYALAAREERLSSRRHLDREPDKHMQSVANCDALICSLTPTVLQLNWKTPSEFPLCPDVVEPGALQEYAESLKFGTVFSKNVFGESMVVDASSNADGSVISVINKMRGNPIKEWAVAKVTEAGCHLIHESSGSFFTLQGAIKQHCAIAEVPWDESIDDYA